MFQWLSLVSKEPSIEVVTCEGLRDLDSETQRRLTAAVAHLQAAQAYNLEDGLGNLLLGRSYCLMGEPDRAVEPYLAYTRLRPTNVVGRLQLAFAYLRACDEIFEQGRSNTNVEGGVFTCPEDWRSAAVAEWRRTGWTAKEFESLGGRAFDERRYELALSMYRAALMMEGQLPPHLTFLSSITAIVSGRLSLDNTSSGALLIHQLDGSLRMAAKTLQWMPSGELLMAYPYKEPALGVMWANGTAVAVVRVSRQGAYRIRVRALNTPPAPVELQIEQDMEPLERFALSRGDMTWEEVEFLTTLDRGFHVIGIRFLNDLYSNISGDDRNAVLDWIELEAVS
jgi:tetratricopeptide (TPR) repeat protein